MSYHEPETAFAAGQAAGIFTDPAKEAFAANYPEVAHKLQHQFHEHPLLTLESLAHEAGMSRTAFANRFRAVMQRTPGKYLASVRLAMAQRAVEQGKGLKQAARAAGYASTSALSRALSRLASSRGA